MRNTFAVNFYLKKMDVKSDGTMPVYCRISINTEKIAFSTKQRVNPKIWEQKTGRAKGKTQAAYQVNVILDSMRNQINARYDEYLKDGETPSPEMLRNDLLGLNAANDTLLTVFADFNERHERSIGIEIAQSTFNKYDLTYRRLQEFLQEKYKVADFRLKKINLDFIMAFESFLRVDHCMTNNSAEKLIRIFKRIVGIARGNGLIQSDPFTNYRIRVKRTRREFLTMEEVETIMRKRFDCERLRKVKDIFVFCCFTGFAFADVSALTNDNIQQLPDGKAWIVRNRQKTGIESAVPLLDVPKAIIAKYAGKQAGERLLPVMSNAKYNLYLKEVVAACGITKKVTSHIARHTFATTVTLNQGVSLDCVSKMLGHTNLNTTRIYAHILNERVSEEMMSLGNKINKKYNYA